jgi:hypothetical protein
MSSWCCSKTCPQGLPQLFVTDKIVKEMFFAVYDIVDKEWSYPVFFNKNSFTGKLILKHFRVSAGISLPAYYSNALTVKASTKPRAYPVLTARDCHMKCVRSASDMLEEQKQQNLLLSVQNKGTKSPMSCGEYILYQKALQTSVPYYTCYQTACPPKIGQSHNGDADAANGDADADADAANGDADADADAANGDADADADADAANGDAACSCG